MADCAICGKPAGMFRSVHQDCVHARDQAKRDIALAFSKMMLVESPPDPKIFKAIIEKLGEAGHLDRQTLRSEVLSGLKISLDTALADVSFSQTELQRFESILSAFDFGTIEIDEAGIRPTLVKSLVLKDLTEGRLSTRLTINGGISIVLKKDEVIQWLFNGVSLSSSRTRVGYKGGSQGFSFRLMQGVSYNVGAHKGERVERSEMLSLGTGDLAITNKAIYFISPGQTKKTTLTSIVAVDAYDDGIVVTPTRGKPQIYLMEEPLFASNLILKVAAL